MTRALDGGTEQVVAYVRGLIESGGVRPGDRLPAERELALQIGVSRPTVRAGSRARGVWDRPQPARVGHSSFQDPIAFLVHDINFHKAVGAASGNPIVASLTEMVSALYSGQRRETAERATPENLRDAAEAHRRIYQAIRLRDAEGARRAMNQHLTEALQYQKQEPGYPAMSASISSSDA